MSFVDNIRKGWNAFLGRDPTSGYYKEYVNGYWGNYRPDRMHFTLANKNTIVTAIYNRIAIDCAAIDIKHVYLDEKGRYSSDVKSSLNECLSVEANTDHVR